MNPTHTPLQKQSIRALFLFIHGVYSCLEIEPATEYEQREVASEMEHEAASEAEDGADHQ
jgi:hypothetical protein